MRLPFLFRCLLLYSIIFASAYAGHAREDSLAIRAIDLISHSLQEEQLLGGGELIDALSDIRALGREAALLGYVDRVEQQLARPLGAEQWGRLYFLRAGIYDHLSKADSAMFHYAEAALYFQKSAQPEFHAWALYGRLCLVAEQNVALLRPEALDELITLTEQGHDDDLKTAVYTLLAYLYTFSEDLITATEWQKKGLELNLRNHNWSAAAYEYYNLAVLASNRSLYARSDSLSRVGIRFQREKAVIDPELMAASYGLLASNALSANNRQLVRPLADSSRTWVALDNTLTGWIDYYEGFIDYLEQTSQYDSAYIYTLQLQVLQDSLQLLLSEEMMQENLAKFRVKEAEYDKQLAEANAARSFTIMVASGAFFVTCVLGLLYLLRQRRKAQRLREENLRIKQAQRVEEIMQEHEIETVRAMLEGQDYERSRIAQELHDGLGGDMAALRWTYDHLTKEYQAQGAPVDRLQRANQQLSKAYEQLRDLSHALNFNNLRQFGLIDSLREMADRIDGVGEALTVSFYSHGESQRLDTQHEIQLFQAIQELTTNVLKHANAKSLSIQLTWLPDELSVIVEDDGDGFDAAKLKDGMGLSSIERRMNDLHAHFSIDSGLGGGTTILIDVPLENPVKA